jgi:DNA-binding GntR family transcriptional regulator
MIWLDRSRRARLEDPVAAAPMTSEARRRTLTDEVADHVRDLVLTGQVREGDFIRIDRVAEGLGISVTPVREGLLALQGEGFVELIPRRGFMVRAVSSQDVADMFWVQGQIEGELTRRAAEHFAAAGVETLVAIQTALEEAARRDDHSRVAELNYDFHHAIAKVVTASRMRWFLKQASRMSPGRLFPQVEGWTRAAVEEHGAILEALRAGDAEAAGVAMTQHVIHAGHLLAGQLKAVTGN